MSNTTSTTSVRFTIDFANKSIVGTAASFKKAGLGSGDVYNELMALIEKHPTFACKEKKQQSRSPKKKVTYAGLDFTLMKEYISIQENSESLMAEYDEVIKEAEEAHSKYPLTKKWFLETFKGFTVEMAKKEISTYKIATAKATAKVKIKARNVTALEPVA